MPLARTSTGLTPAVADLGLGDMLSSQVAGETEEMRKKRMAQMQQNQMLGAFAAAPATQALFPGGYGAGGR